MASQTIGPNIIVAWGGYPLQAKTRSLQLGRSQAAMDETTLPLTTKSNLPGVKDVVFQIEGIYDDADMDAAQDANYTARNYITSVAMGSSEGDLAWFFQSMLGNYDAVKGAHGEIAGFSAGSMAQGYPLVRGIVLDYRNDLASTDSSTGVQWGAVVSGKTIYAAAHCLGIDDNAGDTLDIIIESDDNADFTSATTRFTFSQFTDIGSQILTLAGPITDDYWRVTSTIDGDTPAFDLLVTIGKL